MIQESNIVAFRPLYALNKGYAARIAVMDYNHLLNELIDFNDEVADTNDFSRDLLVRGLILFDALDKNARTNNLKEFCSMYKNHLKIQLRDLRG